MTLRSRILFLIGLLVVVLPVYPAGNLDILISAKESLIQNEANNKTERYAVTSISPGMRYGLDSDQLNVNLNYQLNGYLYHSSESSNQYSQRLSLNSSYQHNRQTATQIFATVRQSVSDVNSARSLLTEVASDNRQEIRVLGVSNQYNKRIIQGLSLSTQVQADVTSGDSQSSTRGLRGSVQLEGRPDSTRFFWSTGLTQYLQQDENQDENTQTANVTLGYSHSRKLDYYLSAEKQKVDKQDIDYSSQSLGLNWIPLATTKINLSVGSRNSNSNSNSKSSTYALSISHKKSRLLTTFSHSESISSARTFVIKQVSEGDDLFSNVLDTSISSRFQVHDRLNLKLEGKKSQYFLQFSQRRSFTDSDESNLDQEIRELRFGWSRKLGPKGRISIDVEREYSTSTLSSNQVNKLSTRYAYNAGRSFTTSIQFSWAEQDSSNFDLQSKQLMLMGQIEKRF